MLTQPDRPHGRGLRLAPSPVKAYAAAHGMRVEQPPTLRDPALLAPLVEVALDVLVVAAYGLILPRAVLDWPRLGCINVHASLLPRWRGAAPIARAIEAGDVRSGVSIMQMDEGLDTGPVLAEVPVTIDPGETAGSLHDKLAPAGAAALLRVLACLADGDAVAARPQPAEGATYAAKIAPAEAALDWRRPAEVLDRQVRAFDPVPGAHVSWAGERVKVAGSSVTGASVSAPPGSVVAVDERGVDVACGDAGVLRLARLKPAGGKAMSAAAFARGRGVRAGARFDAASS